MTTRVTVQRGSRLFTRDYSGDCRAWLRREFLAAGFRLTRSLAGIDHYVHPQRAKALATVSVR